MSSFNSLLNCHSFRSSRKEAAKEEAKKTEMERLQNTILELYLQTEQQEAQIKELARYIFELGTFTFFLLISY